MKLITTHMLTKILIGTLLVFFTGNTLFAQQKTENSNAKKDIYVPGMTKEEKAEKVYQESLKQEEIKKSNVPAVENKNVPQEENKKVNANKEIPIINKNDTISTNMEENNGNNSQIKTERKVILLDKTKLKE